MKYQGSKDYTYHQKISDLINNHLDEWKFELREKEDIFDNPEEMWDNYKLAEDCHYFGIDLYNFLSEHNVKNVDSWSYDILDYINHRKELINSLRKQLSSEESKSLLPTIEY